VSGVRSASAMAWSERDVCGAPCGGAALLRDAHNDEGARVGGEEAEHAIGAVVSSLVASRNDALNQIGDVKLLRHCTKSACAETRKAQ
jgi:hypothetical protein